MLEGRYELTSLIATGGMGQVWKGRDQDLDRDIAVKVLREEYAGDEGFLKRFRAEARHTASLSHDAIAALYAHVYDVHVDESSNVVLDMTLTSAACPLTDVIEDQTNSALEGLAADVTINWVWMPPWGPDKITDDGREQLRALGFNV